MNTKLISLKEELKSIAKQITNNKKEIKETQRKGKYAGSLQYETLKEQRDYRHKHIAYCLLRGRKYEEIENKTREGNEPNLAIIKKIQEAYSEATQDVRTCA